MAKRKDKLEEKGESHVLNPPELEINEGVNDAKFDEIIKTTDSMVFMASRDKFGKEKNKQMMKQSRDAISQSYELARRRINSTYEEVVDTGAYIGIQFLAVQITLINYDNDWDIKKVEHSLNIFVKAMLATVNKGKGVALTKDIVLEPVVYIDKILPASKMTPDFASLVNSYRWEELFDELVQENRLTIADKAIIEDFALAVDENIKKGYYIELLDIILARINMERSDTIMLYSYDTLLKMNREYNRSLELRKEGIRNSSNESNNYSRTFEMIEKAKEEDKINRGDSKHDEDFKANDDVDVVQPPSDYLEKFSFEQSLPEKQRRKLEKERETKSNVKQTIDEFVDDISSEMKMNKDEIDQEAGPSKDAEKNEIDPDLNTSNEIKIAETSASTDDELLTNKSKNEVIDEKEKAEEVKAEKKNEEKETLTEIVGTDTKEVEQQEEQGPSKKELKAKRKAEKAEEKAEKNRLKEEAKLSKQKSDDKTTSQVNDALNKLQDDKVNSEDDVEQPQPPKKDSNDEGILLDDLDIE